MFSGDVAYSEESAGTAILSEFPIKGQKNWIKHTLKIRSLCCIYFSEFRRGTIMPFFYVLCILFKGNF